MAGLKIYITSTTAVIKDDNLKNVSIPKGLSLEVVDLEKANAKLNKEFNKILNEPIFKQKVIKRKKTSHKMYYSITIYTKVKKGLPFFTNKMNVGNPDRAFRHARCWKIDLH